MRRYGIGLSLVSFGLVGCSTPERWATEGMEERAVVYDAGPPEPAPLSASPEVVVQNEPPGLEAPWQLSIEEAILYALQRNRDLQAQRLDPVIAGAFEKIERGTYDPTLFAELSYGEESVREAARSVDDQYSVEGEDGAAEVGLRQQLPTGTTVELTASQDFSTFSRSDRPDNSTQELHETRVGITVTQALLRGFGPAANLARIWQAERETLATEYELRAFAEETVASVELAYWQFVLARESIAIFQRSLEVARQNRDEIEQQIEVGLLSRTDGAAARAEVALREQGLIDARSELEAARLRLSFLLLGDSRWGLDLKIEATSPVQTDPVEVGLVGERVALARNARPELNESRLRLEQRRLETVVTRNGLLPRLDFFVSLGRSGFGSDRNESMRDLDGTSYDLNTGLSLNYHLGNREARGLDLVARAEKRQAEIALANLESQIEMEVRLAVNEVERAREQISASAVSRELREESARAEQERFEVGSSTGLLVAQAQRDLLESRLAEVGAMIDYRRALIQLYLAEGSLLERRGITLRIP